MGRKIFLIIKIKTEKERKQIRKWQENVRETHSKKKMQIKPSLKNEKKVINKEKNTSKKKEMKMLMTRNF